MSESIPKQLILHESMFPRIDFDRAELLASPAELTKEMDLQFSNNSIQYAIEINTIYEKLLKHELSNSFMKRNPAKIFDSISIRAQKNVELILDKIEKESCIDARKIFSSTESVSKINSNHNTFVIERDNIYNIKQGMKESNSNTEITARATPNHERNVSVENIGIIKSLIDKGSIMNTPGNFLRENIELAVVYSQKLLKSVISKIHSDFKSVAKLIDVAFENKPLTKMQYFKKNFLQFTDLLSLCCYKTEVDSFLKLKDSDTYESKIVNKNIIKTVKHYSCGGLITFQLINSLFVLFCLKCELLVSIDQIFCSKFKFECVNCFRAFSSDVRVDNLLIKELNKKDVQLSKPTFEFYHCNLFKDQIVGCKYCKSKQFLDSEFCLVVCYTCLKVSKNEAISYSCYDCGSEFSTRLKVYDQDEPDVLKEIIKLNLKDKKLAKPVFPKGNLYNIICKCFVGSRDKYYHSSTEKCNGVLYKGEVDGASIVVCSKCKSAWYENFIVWSCPKCNIKFTNKNLLEKYELNTHDKRNNNSKLASSSSLSSTMTEGNVSDKKIQTIIKKEMTDRPTNDKQTQFQTINQIDSSESEALNIQVQSKDELLSQPMFLVDKDKEDCFKREPKDIKEAFESPKIYNFSNIHASDELIQQENEVKEHEAFSEKKQSLQNLITMSLIESNIIEEEDSDNEELLRTQSNNEYDQLKVTRKESIEDLEIQIVTQSPSITRQNAKKLSSPPAKIKLMALSPYGGKNRNYISIDNNNILNLVQLSEEADCEVDNKAKEIRAGKLSNITARSINVVPDDIKNQEANTNYSQPFITNSKKKDSANLILSKFTASNIFSNSRKYESPKKSNYNKSNLILSEKPRAISIVPGRATTFNRSLTGQSLYNTNSNYQASQKANFSKDYNSSSKNISIGTQGQGRPTIIYQEDSGVKNEIHRGISISNKFCGSQNININIKIEGLNSIAINNTNNYNTEINQPSLPINESSNCNVININMFKILKQIGEGTFAKIYQVEELSTKKLFAIKKFIGHSKEDIKALNSEFDLLSKMNHRQILKIYGMSTYMLDHTTYVLYILMESATCDWYREIQNRIEQNKSYNEKEIWNILFQLISVFAMLQKEMISHRDIKPQNILIFKGGIFKLCDFGEAKKIKELGQQETIRGSELYMSPSLFTGLTNKIKKVKHNCFKSDVFSLGMSILLSACLNFDLLYAVRKNSEPTKVKDLIANSLKSKGYSLKLINLLLHMTSQDEERRPDFIELKSSLNIMDS